MPAGERLLAAEVEDHEVGRIGNVAPLRLQVAVEQVVGLLALVTFARDGEDGGLLQQVHLVLIPALVPIVVNVVGAEERACGLDALGLADCRSGKDDDVLVVG